MVIICDIGTDSCKLGFDGDNVPLHIISSVVGTSLNSVSKQQSSFVGNLPSNNETQQIFSSKYPIERGVISDWEAMDKLFQHMWSNKLHIDPKEHSILLTEPLFNPKSNREDLAQLCFENYSFPSLFVEYQPVLSFYYSVRTCGVILESGDGVTCVLPIYEWNALHHASLRQDFGGRDVTHYLMQLLSQKQDQFSFHSLAEREIVKDMKHSRCRVLSKTEVEQKKQEEMVYCLPNGDSIVIKDELFQCCEALFSPHLFSQEKQELGFHQLLSKSLSLCDVDLRKDLYCNIYMCGGDTLFNGLIDRLSEEIKELIPITAKSKIIAPEERCFSSWICGSILASLSLLNNVSITLQEYREYGPSIMHSKQSGR